MKYITSVLFYLSLCSFGTRTIEIPEYNKYVDQVLWVVNDLTNTMTLWANLDFNFPSREML